MAIRVMLDPGHGAGRAHNRGFVGGDNERIVVMLERMETALAKILEERNVQE